MDVISWPHVYVSSIHMLIPRPKKASAHLRAVIKQWRGGQPKDRVLWVKSVKLGTYTHWPRLNISEYRAQSAAPPGSQYLHFSKWLPMASLLPH